MRSGLRVMIIVRDPIDLCYDIEHGDRIVQSRRRDPISLYVLDELHCLVLPRVVRHWKFPDARLRWTHLGEHSIPSQPFDAIAAAQTIDLKLPGLAVDLERKHVLPLRAT